MRAFRAVGGQPLFIERGQGAYLYDVDGNRFIDYVMFTPFFADAPITNWASAKKSNTQKSSAYFRAMLERDV